MSNAVWPTLIGTLGGVLITACFGLATAYFTHRWQTQHLRNDYILAERTEIRLARRATYARYIVTAQNVYSRSFDLYLLNRDNPIIPKEFQIAPPAELDALVTQNESLRVEVLLISGPVVEEALNEYTLWLRSFWPKTASGTALEYDGHPNRAYQQLIEAMRAESVDYLQFNTEVEHRLE